MIPRLAALSIAEISAPTCSAVGVCADRTPFCIVRNSVTTLRLRSDRLSAWRVRFAADFVFAIVPLKVVDHHAGERIPIVNSEGRAELASNLRRVSPRPGVYKRLFDSSFAFSLRAARAPP